ncbi:putative ABC-type arginine transport system,permease component [Vibrio nigripulchritudo SFn27]|uniref:Glutamate/aspartate import permease protein GltK n=1 Tax=Vibrio nigripulchritudo TaxID=28173 RepID=U4KHS8_9VIBR|nr:amino acid ABC transporter permease [Vibrio nigripulchritudo]KJY70327.1 amino acid ABC transporter permease [Vibrio nigripulchritudo]CCN33397.1 putative ABC-type arginine transport system,permease component [Vibrio nigripulchritudo AM115]CCN42937.1 putative ABC-type arginine transport system,permease component [Vibrio nigripulchritudo FTn2]CCN65421.1 putative ABC-type arginine transport system,permease component [Vibrio nigripulchritudo POn4]CCN79486.1 putative ABC-type arginine transport s
MRLSSLFVALSVFLLSGCSDYQWGWYVLDPTTEQGLTNLKFLIAGFEDTIYISLISMFLAMLLGLIVALPALSEKKALRAVNRVYVESVRSIPVLVLLLWVYYGLPTLLDVSLDYFAAGVIALTIAESAFMAEVFRGGIQAIARGQHEAAESLGLNYWQKMRLVILPQAFRQILPPLGNQFVYILKMSSLVSVIGLSDLTRRANELVVNEYLPLEIYTFLVIEYLVLILFVSQCVRWLEKRIAIPSN